MENDLQSSDPRAVAASDTARRRVVDERTAAAMLGMSLIHLRRLRKGHVGPMHVKLGVRRIGYKIGDVYDWLDSRTFSDVAHLLRRN